MPIWLVEGLAVHLLCPISGHGDGQEGQDLPRHDTITAARPNYRNITLCAVAIVILGALTQGAISTQTAIAAQDATEARLAVLATLQATHVMVSIYIITLLVWILRWSINASQRLNQILEIADTVSDSVLTIKSDGKIEIANKASQGMFGWAQNEMRDRPLSSIIAAEDGDGNIDLNTQNLLAGDASSLGQLDRQTIACRGTKRDGSHFPAELFVSKNHESDEQRFTCVIKDISQKLQSEATIHHLSNCDVLTGLANRREFHRALEEALSAAREPNSVVGVMLLDLDKFKQINEVCGHNVGDSILKTIAERLESSVRDVDTVARLSGDEFAIIVTGLSHYDDTITPVEDMLSCFESPISFNDTDHRISASIGIACYPSDGKTGSELLRQADVALHHAKASGRGSYHLFNSQLDHQVKSRKALEDGLCRAFERNEFSLHYQPQVDMDGQLVGAESLLRWRLPDGNYMPAGEFIPVAEATGLIVKLGEWALFEACRQAKAWQDAGMPKFRMAINISAAQFAEVDLVDTVAEALAQSGLAPTDLELEITESMVLHDIDDAIEKLTSLHQMGIELAIDDFGTGYASLTYLKRMPVHRLKIDQSFVAGVPDDEGDAAITASVINLGATLGLEVVAEGVENVRQLVFLKNCGCNVAQGYYIGRPMPVERFENWLITRAKSPTEILQDQINQI